jgi:UDP-N-acetylglucosamine--dolichyl-phosphate N-acetylglucosaminephosphotransferase
MALEREADDNGVGSGVVDAKRQWDMVLFGALCLLPTLLVLPSLNARGATRHLVGTVAAVSVLAYAATVYLVRVVTLATLRRGMFGYDINKKGTPAGSVRVPEAAGLAPGCVYLASLTVLQCAHLLLGGQAAAHWAVEHNSALATIGFAVFLGFVDDVLDLPWRAKMIVPACASLPLLLSYAGSTTILVPRPLRRLLGEAVTGGADLLDLGAVYYAYMFLLVIFCANSINIHAGINGLEAGQSAVIAAAVVLLNVSTLASTGTDTGVDVGSGGSETGVGPGKLAMSREELVTRAEALRNFLGGGSPVVQAAFRDVEVMAARDTRHVEVMAAQLEAGGTMHEAHLFSLCLAAPFLACTLGLMAHNWYPSKVFVGDTFTYFAGMTLGVAGILGHFSETLVIFFLPQIANFLYSSPQLFKFVHCPRHRLPTLDTATGLLHPSMATETRYNMNLVNLFLRILGPQTERRLCVALLTLQAACCAAGFALRHMLTGVWK